MRKEMGNQNTSGIVAEEKATSEAPEREQEVISCQDDLKEADKIVIQEDDEKADFQEKALGSDCHEAEAEADGSPDDHDKLKSDEKEVSEDANRSVGDYETRTDAIADVSSNHAETKESNFEDEISKFNNEVNDQPCTLEGETQRNEMNLEPKSTYSNTLTHEDVDIASEPQEDQNIVMKLIADTKVEQDLCVSSDSDIDDHDVIKNQDDLVVADDTSSVESPLLETCTDKETELRMASIADNADDDIGKDRGGVHEDHLRDEQDDSFDALDDLPRIGLQDLSEAKNEKQDEFLALNEEKSIMNELGNEDDDMGHVDQTRPNAQQDIKKNDEEDSPAVEIGPVFGPDNVVLVDEVKENGETNKDTNEATVMFKENMVLTEGDLSTTTADVTDHQVHCTVTIESEIPQAPLSSEQYTLEDKGEKGKESVQVELRKSPSFDFGLPFDARSEESDQTPLLYQDRAARRSLSSCSNLRFQNRSVQTECIGTKSLIQYEVVEVEEKTIRMERSSSESFRLSSLNSMGNKDEKANVVAKEVNGSKGEDSDVISPKGNGKRKPRSSLFTTCICCTAAIS